MLAVVTAVGRTWQSPDGVPIRLAEPTALTLVRPGDKVDLLGVDESGGTHAVAAAALVLGVTGADDPHGP